MKKVRIGKINGVNVKKLVLHHDNRGFLTEVLRADEEILETFGQFTFTEAYSEVIKAFHWHEIQTDHWFFAYGQAEIVLFDDRPGSPTRGTKQVIHAGESNRVLVSIPPGVWHGYRVLNNSPAGLCYLTTECYNPDNPDEHREDHDAIEHHWETLPR